MLCPPLTLCSDWQYFTKSSQPFPSCQKVRSLWQWAQKWSLVERVALLLRFSQLTCLYIGGRFPGPVLSQLALGISGYIMLRWSAQFASSEASEEPDRDFQQVDMKLQCFSKSHWSLIAFLCAEIFWKILPCPAFSMSHLWHVLQQGLSQPTLTSKTSVCLDLSLQFVPKGLPPEADACFSFPCTASEENPPQTAMINAYTTSFFSENSFFWYPGEPQQKDGTSCSPARGTEGADLVSHRLSCNCEGERGTESMSSVGWAFTST